MTHLIISFIGIKVFADVCEQRGLTHAHIYYFMLFDLELVFLVCLSPFFHIDTK